MQDFVELAIISKADITAAENNIILAMVLNGYHT
jgi:hypothetical protein